MITYRFAYRLTIDGATRSSTKTIKGYASNDAARRLAKHSAAKWKNKPDIMVEAWEVDDKPGNPDLLPDINAEIAAELAREYTSDSSPSPKPSPLITAHREIKATLPPDTLLIYRLGDFGELFEADAVIAAKVLKITLTNRQGIPMAGVPWHALNQYVKELQAAGHTVALCEEIPKAGVIPKVTTV